MTYPTWGEGEEAIDEQSSSEQQVMSKLRAEGRIALSQVRGSDAGKGVPGRGNSMCKGPT